MNPLFIYGNWAAYDELSDGIELTEELAMTQFDHLLRMRAQGVRFDAYLMDAFWFARDGGYREWRTPTWPNGPDRWLAACAEHGLLPGLWFTVNTLCHLDPAPQWVDSVDEKGWGMCMFEGGFLADFIDILDHWFSRGIRIFKFDFAEFNAVPAGRAIEDARAKNIAAFRSAMLDFRLRHPEAILMAFNGFEEREVMDRTDHEDGPTVDLAWLDVFDSIYCGDPRPADVPCIDFWRSVDIYHDHMTMLYHRSGIPLDRIDNCGFMVGNTGTCYWRGKAGWQSMLILSLARGGRIHVAYGDLSLFTDEDARWWARVQDLYIPSMRPGGTQTDWDWGMPGKGNSYTYIATDSEMVTQMDPAFIASGVPNSEGGISISYFGRDDRVQIFVDPVDNITSQLQVRSYAMQGVSSLMPENAPAVEPFEWEIVPADQYFDPNVRFIMPATYTEAFVMVRQLTPDGRVKRTYPRPDAPQPLTVYLIEGDQRHLLPATQDRVIWSGMSWTMARLPVGLTGEIHILSETIETEPVMFWAFIYWR